MEPAETGRLRSHLLPLAGILVLSFLAYANTFDVPFQFDDFPAIVNNRTVRDFSDLVSIASFQPTRLVVFWTFAFNFAVNNFSTFHFHTVNLTIHILNGVLVYVLLNQVQEKTSNQGSSSASATIVAALCAFVWVSHPIQTQAVTYICQRITLMGAFFYLAAVVLYLWSRMRNRTSFSVQMAILIPMILGMFSKENTITIPLTFLIAEYVLFKQKPAQILKQVASMPLLFASILIVPCTTFFFGNLQLRHIQESSQALSPLGYFITQPYVLLKYLGIIGLIHPQSIEHSIPVFSAFSKEFLVPFTVLSALFVFAFILKRKYALISFGILFFFSSAAVESSFVPLVDLSFEHRMYLPLVGLCIVLLGLLQSLRRRLESAKAFKPSVSILLALIVCLPLANISHARNEVWRSKVSLWTDAFEKNPDNERVNTNLANALFESKKILESIVHYKKAAELAPEVEKNQYHLGMAYINVGDLEQAHGIFTSMELKNPDSFFAQYAMAVYFEKSKRYTESLEKINGLKPAPVGLQIFVLQTTIEALVGNSEFSSALDKVDTLLRLEPNNPKFLFLKAKILALLGRKAEAEFLVDHCKKSFPGFEECISTLPNVP